MLAMADLFVIGNITCCVIGRFNIGVLIGFYAFGFLLNIYDFCQVLVLSYWLTAKCLYCVDV